MSISTQNARTRKHFSQRALVTTRRTPREIHFTLLWWFPRRNWGGGEEQARLLAHGLKRLGHTCSVLARRHGKFASRMVQEGFPWKPFPAVDEVCMESIAFVAS